MACSSCGKRQRRAAAGSNTINQPTNGKRLVFYVTGANNEPIGPDYFDNLADAKKYAVENSGMVRSKRIDP